jgi:hypothetical protein
LELKGFGLTAITRAVNRAGHELAKVEHQFLGAPEQRNINSPGQSYNSQIRRLPALDESPRRFWVRECQAKSAAAPFGAQSLPGYFTHTVIVPTQRMITSSRGEFLSGINGHVRDLDSTWAVYHAMHS